MDVNWKTIRTGCRVCPSIVTGAAYVAMGIHAVSTWVTHMFGMKRQASDRLLWIGTKAGQLVFRLDVALYKDFDVTCVFTLLVHETGETHTEEVQCDGRRISDVIDEVMKTTALVQMAAPTEKESWHDALTRSGIVIIDTSLGA